VPLCDEPRFARPASEPPGRQIGRLLRPWRAALQGGWVHCGYSTLDPMSRIAAPALDVTSAVDNTFRLGPVLGFERTPAVVTTGLRTSRFAPLLYWEVLHTLAAGGTWIDIDEADRCAGTALTREDFMVRAYFRSCLSLGSRRTDGRHVVHAFRKTSSSPIAERIGERGWTFGILTSGNSPRAAEMARAILALDLPAVEVVVCGPRPSGAPTDPRVRAIDLESPEPRGWITRKKNLVAGAARHENLCVLHDRFHVTPDWAAALTAYGPCFSVLTFPQRFQIDDDNRFGQRYADYQVLHQAPDPARALAARVYPGDRVLYAPYDDFYETAFCCGGLYLAKRSIWNRVKQDEALYHCEWEDVTFGLECQRQGIPHRVNPFLTARSLTPHPMALTRLHDLVEPDQPARGRLHVAAEQAESAARTPGRFRSVVPMSRATYYERVRRRFNAVSGLPAGHAIDAHELYACAGLSDFWRVVERHVASLPIRTRADLAELLFFLSDTIYNWPNCELMTALAAAERARLAAPSLDGFAHVVGWGTGSAFRSMHKLIGRRLDWVIDREAARWGTWVEGVCVRPPRSLQSQDPANTAVVVFSCFFDAVADAARAEGPFTIVSGEALVAGRRLGPLSDMVAHYHEVERYYPRLFDDARMELAA
jgi:hypothetical protein